MAYFMIPIWRFAAVRGHAMFKVDFYVFVCSIFVFKSANNIALIQGGLCSHECCDSAKNYTWVFARNKMVACIILWNWLSWLFMRRSAWRDFCAGPQRSYLRVVTDNAYDSAGITMSRKHLALWQHGWHTCVRAPSYNQSYEYLRGGVSPWAR